ncbi:MULTISPECIES: sulfotransferase [unclassified Lysobacter]|uniref:tetratricopeptide repeat-containing sulfotransferase family protein n=1 Tax=unclassified Lysobacter TaxID=2635362 RepID=UPI001F5731C3|nr:MULTISPECIES: sulfotransferase [unclassified Lysobacter]
MQNEDAPPVPAEAGVRQQLEAGLELLRRGEIDQADAIAGTLLPSYGDDTDVLAFACELRLAQDEPEDALELIERAIALSPQPQLLLPRKAHVLMALMRRADAREVATRIADLAGEDGRQLWTAGRIHARCENPAVAVEYYERALQAGCDDPGLLYDLASSRFFLGQFEQAERNLDALLVRRPTSGDALYLRSTLRRQTRSRNNVADLEARLKSGIRNPVDAAGCLYSLAKEHEDLEQWDKAFSALSHGARIKRGSLQYDAAAELAAIDGIRSAYPVDVIGDEDGGHSEAGAIFIVGMPRTGTTLVERILGRHSKVESAGELPYFAGALATAARRRMRDSAAANMVEASLGIDFAALGRAYMEGARQAVPGAGMIIDKMPVNFMYCGLIRKALPNARIVHVVRDPMDTCYAVYKTLFQKAYFFSNDLDELAAYYLTYRRLMAHWHAVMPGRILDLSYEDLVTDTESQARRLLAWCGLDWDPAVLAPHSESRPVTTASAAQVREPVHAASVGKWRRYAAGLEPLRRQLQAGGVLQL